VDGSSVYHPFVCKGNRYSLPSRIFFRTLGQVDDMYHAIIQSGDKNSSTPIIPGKALDTVLQGFSESDRYFNCMIHVVDLAQSPKEDSGGQRIPVPLADERMIDR